MLYLETFFNSFGQVFLIRSPFFGFFIFAGMLIVQPRLLTFSALGAIIGIFFAKMIGVENSIIQAGLMGFNAALVGVACGVLIQKNEYVIIAVLLGSALTVLIQLLSMKYEISIFTLPFVIVAMIVFFLKPFLGI